MSVLPTAFLAVVTGWLWPPPDASYQPVLLAFAAVVPDLDRVVGAFSPRFAARAYRSVGHSIPALGAWVVLVAFVAHWIDPRPGFWTALALAGMGVGVHVLVDLASPAGLALLGRRRIGLSLLAPQDVLLVALPVLALGIGAAWPAGRLGLGAATWLLLLYAVGLRAHMRRKARVLGAEALGRSPAHVCPTPWSPFRWLCIVRDGPDRWLVEVDTGKGRAGEPKRLAAPKGSAVVDALESTGAVLARAGAGRGGREWIVDLRYAYRWPVPPAGVLCDEEGNAVRLHLP